MYSPAPIRRRRTRRAFTLIELLVVLGVIAVLLAILLPVLFSMRERGRRTACLSNLHQLDTALLAYTQDADGFFPTRGANGSGHHSDWTDGVQKHVQEADVFHCPSCPILALISQKEPGEPQDKDGGYSLNFEISGAYTPVPKGVDGGSPIPTADMTVPFPATTVALCEVAFRDGPGKDTVSFSTATDAPDTGDGLESNQTVFGPPGAVRHQGGSNYGFVDGHVHWYRPNQVAGAEDAVNGVLLGNNGSSPTFAR
jgi:prepilin-type N-terminal cleavage/methylation domain-containing protein/prepilin-type processing-associated H-X9-DG protein